MNMDLFLITGCVEDIKTKILTIDELIMKGNEEDIDWEKLDVLQK